MACEAEKVLAMRKRKSPEAGWAALERLERQHRQQQEDDEKCERLALTLMGMPRICKFRRCRRARLCCGSPPACFDLYKGLVWERWPSANGRILRWAYPRQNGDGRSSGSDAEAGPERDTD
jgi:hypothetical protein